ncbi:LysR family transcriptional regulator, regulator for metE and metH [Paracoccus isoporae]|uniref:HTH-type transcriptional regulator MetR n=1 Tax=Paracoccus isoporae TaxID=591205 RepID=A0A1G6YUP5_9RHOB|nr:LysR family transcriptional regulator [Paracoccus isoporae]SDD93306.1 LysR family transcriptional regulator, regulator for metE and metH [Paracoccus isoporae]
MHLELRHLRTVRAIHDQGGLARAAETLNITQSALSHQVKALEEQVGVELFVRRARPMRLSAAGLRLLRLAEQVLPQVEAAEAELKGVEAGRVGRLHVALECHACFDWILPALDQFRRGFPEVDLDIRQRLAFTALPALQREEVDLVISMDPDDLPEIHFEPLFDYSPTLVVSAMHALAGRGWVRPEDLAPETLIVYPMYRERLDVFSEFLGPAKVEPREVRQIELTDVTLMLVAAGRGVAVMPDWVLRRHADNPELAFLRLGEAGVTRTVHAAVRGLELQQPYMQHFLRLAKLEGARNRRPLA